MKRFEKVTQPDGSVERVPKNLKKRLNLNYLTYTNMTYAVGAHDLPAITCNTEVLPDYIALYTHPGDYFHTAHTAVGFFLYDDTFDGKDGLYNAIYYNDKRRLEFFKKRFAGVRMFIMPDITQAGDVDDIENHYRLKKMRVVSIWLTMEIGAVVIPFITFPTLGSIDFALDGYEECSVVCFSTMGYIDDPIEREVLRKAIERTVDTLSLRAIVVFDVCQDNDRTLDLFSYAVNKGIQICIPMNMLKQRNMTRKEAKDAKQ